MNGKEIDQIAINSKGMVKEDLAYIFTDGKNKVKITDSEFAVYVQ